MALSYEYSIGSVRAREKSLLTAVDLEQLLACKSEGELCALLGDKGYGDGKSVDEIIDNHTQAMWRYLKDVAPDFALFNVFLIQNDNHNLKVVIKGSLSARKYRHLLVMPATLDAEDMVKAVESRGFALLPEWIAKNADKAYETLAHTGDARLSDAYLDRATTEEMLRLSKQWRSAFLADYIHTFVFYNNVKTAIRSARANANCHYVKRALFETDGFDKPAVLAAALKGEDSVLELLGKCQSYGCAQAIEAYRQSPSAFERFVDDRLTRMAKDACKHTSEGAEPLLGYYLGCEAEKKAVHIIASGIRTGTDADAVRERLREIYG